ncbi:MAG TPA: glycosyltransferase family 39 protein [Candidatus Polarisedimenticolia bacterium]|nr:glycosyltransferase family 39 protein [Candidatus Polarisedimenticolia bacterium]
MRAGRAWAAAALLLAVMAAQMVTAIPHASAVVDEPAHLAAGYRALAAGDLVVNREHPPLAKAIAALPLLFSDIVLPAAPAEARQRATEDFEFGYSREFLYKANDADALLGLARLPIVAMTLCAGVALFVWARRLPLSPDGAAARAAVAALALFAFEPNLLAHGRLVTTDMAATLFALCTFACLERSLGKPGRSALWAALSGVCLGAALASRFSSLLLVPLMAVSTALDRRAPGAPRWRLLGLSVLVALVVLNLCYGELPGASIFPVAAEPIGGPLHSQPLGMMEANPALRRIPMPVPRLYIEGLDLARWKNRYVEGPGFLNGAYSSEGWWSYFVLALSMKTSLPLLLLSAVGAGATLAGLRRAGPAARTLLAHVLVPAAGMILLVTAMTRAQIGLRYVLPAIPFLCLAASAGACRLRLPPWTGRAALALPALLLVWHAAGALRVHPYHLAYINEAWGGPQEGYRRLVDSNYDWGQDLVGLRRFMDERRLQRINLYYFGTADPAYYRIERAVPPEPGYYAVSATHLAGVYLPQRDYLSPFAAMTPETTIGYSIRVYHLEQVPEFLRTPIRAR